MLAQESLLFFIATLISVVVCIISCRSLSVRQGRFGFIVCGLKQSADERYLAIRKLMKPERVGKSSNQLLTNQLLTNQLLTNQLLTNQLLT
ncbi:MAG: hypothetical protein AAFP09_16275, partial [Cyanobacteria bacterium J06607_10]